MWRNPKYPAPPAPAPPEETGQRLATLPRGEGVELRANLAEWQGRAFLSLRVWERNDQGAWWPVKGKGVSIRLSECGPLGDVLTELAEGGMPVPDASGGQGASVVRSGGTQSRSTPPRQDDRPQFIEKNPRPQRVDTTRERPVPSSSRQPFSEFD